MCLDQDDVAEVSQLVPHFEVAAAIKYVDRLSSYHDDHLRSIQARIVVLNDLTEDCHYSTLTVRIKNSLYWPVHSNVFLIPKAQIVEICAI